MSNLVLNCEILNHVLEGKKITIEDAKEIFNISKHNPTELFNTAQTLRTNNKKNIVTFSKKVFFNVVNLCKDICSYCTYKAEPGESKLSMMNKDDILQLAQIAKKYRCVEALFVTGERPEERYDDARKWLKNNGFSSTAEYLAYCSEIALENGLFPHTNAGNLTKDEMKELRKTNPSMGLMLENSSERLAEKNMPHHFAPSKKPEARLRVLENAGELGIPMTTGILVGIGETENEIIESIFAIKKIHERFGNIQEVILQNFQPKDDTIMSDSPPVDENYFKRIVALTRVIMPDMNIQIPPNLSPMSYQSFLSVGINDWGGISPLTPDYVNPEFLWPRIQNVEENCQKEGFELRARFPVYPEFLSFVDSKIRDKMSEIQDCEGFVKREYWK
ncbi:MAG: 7,8-didemethyl-8-hydroxy-5-deazariboflavin synthase subunit CofG [Nitrosopumilales archaeon]|nr:7,8-didemethyl-8-hydroxy-5-deazariboflavin synthase subunit CofG [Nitrosopumilales archaeon]